ncbi:LysR family transcriptional regulator [Pusillimonas sp. CC-YST705]|uniref:LysR family transcriptional regulator n=1 Tax=Mesopusillimonas faecipullorum TaxID=2755040 RepID=A0ABS8CBB8_9BURK|nr:LysR family transcriptional regulator [Mesopusillimonas faecipullorum]MCB5363283.1 LysR family transcriptional regulator [Mesopusillimonas faecipullorum]
MDKLKQLESFVAVATLGSLSAAARAEGVAPAMVARRINALEARLGIKLLVRSTRRLSLTEEGTLLLGETQRILQDLNDTETRVAQGSHHPNGHLRISAPAGFGRKHVAPLIPAFLERYPDVTLSLDLSDRLVDLIEERYDCAIRIGDLSDSDVIGIRLADNRRVIVAAPAYLDRHGTPRTPDDLAQHNCLSFGHQSNQSRGWQLLINGQVRALRVSGNMSCSDGSALHEWTLGGYGLSWRSLWEVRDDLAAGRLISVLDSYAAPANGIFALLAERKHLPLRVRVFLEMLREAFAPINAWVSKTQQGPNPPKRVQ